MNALQATTDNPQIDTSETGGTLTHAHSFALRQAIITQLNTSQMAEHDSLNAMREISINHTRQILQILTDWLCSGYTDSSISEIEAMQIISEQQHSEWLNLVGKKNELEESLKTTTEDFLKAENEYNEIAGFLGKNKIWAKGEEKIKINNAETKREELKIQKNNLEDSLRKTNEETKTYGDTFIENCCKNLDQISDGPPIGGKLHKVVQETKEKISVEWFRHCQQQRQELESITKNIECLTKMYSIEVKS